MHFKQPFYSNTKGTDTEQQESQGALPQLDLIPPDHLLWSLTDGTMCHPVTGNAASDMNEHIPHRSPTVSL